MWEGIGQRLSVVMAGGVLMVEVSKRVHAPSGGLKAAVRRPLQVLDGLGRPVAGRNSLRDL
jgi:hypothetical protein